MGRRALADKMELVRQVTAAQDEVESWPNWKKEAMRQEVRGGFGGRAGASDREAIKQEARTDSNKK